MNRICAKLSYSNVVATVALFAALGGSAFAATQLPKGSVGTRQLRDGSITAAKIRDGAITTAKLHAGAATGAKVNESTLGPVPNALHATTADSATATAPASGGAPTAGAPAPAGPEAVHLVGTAGEPPFENGAEDFSSDYLRAGFWKDRECVVHLQGGVGIEGEKSVFTLPAAFRPAQNVLAPIAQLGPGAANVTVFADGEVEPSGSGAGVLGFGLDGVSFRAAQC